jgi:release factor glutamine methyltransferase
MITLLESINLSTTYLQQKGIESPRINSELLLADIIGCKRLDLYLSFDRPLSDIEIKKYRVRIKRRANFEPLQYIIGKVEFYGLELIVNSSVLIPRPETEILVESIIRQYQKNDKLSVLEIGCGSGNIAIALAVNLPGANILATDISEHAIKVASENAKRNNVSDNIKFIKHDILKDNLNHFPMFDIIVSNPPYVSKENYSSLQKEIKYFEPRTAVTDEGDGYTFFNEISAKVPGKMNKTGKLFFEVAQGQSTEIKNILLKNNFTDVNSVKDYQEIERIVYGGIK